MSTSTDPKTPQITEDAETVRLAAQKKRSVWLGLALFGFVLLIGVTSALQLKANIQKNSNANIERTTGEGA
ncbi:MAG: hypothetical protein ABJG15_11865 [Hyphomonadaceae bacterium]